MVPSSSMGLAVRVILLRGCSAGCQSTLKSFNNSQITLHVSCRWTPHVKHNCDDYFMVMFPGPQILARPPAWIINCSYWNRFGFLCGKERKVELSWTEAPHCPCVSPTRQQLPCSSSILLLWHPAIPIPNSPGNQIVLRALDDPREDYGVRRFTWCGSCRTDWRADCLARFFNLDFLFN